MKKLKRFSQTLLISLPVGLIAISLLTGCKAFRRARRARPPAATSAPPATVAPATAAPTSVPPTSAPGSTPTPLPPTEAPTSAPTATPEPPPAVTPTTPPLEGMTFVEKNNLFLDLLSARQAEGTDTTAAEELYIRSLEATLEGDSALADQYLDEAILELLPE